MTGENDNQGGDGGKEFAPITSQEQLNRLIGERINSVKSQYADYDDLKTKASKFDEVTEASKTELQKERERATAAETERDALKAEKQVATWASEIVKGSTIPANALRGSTKEELAEHFEVLKSFATPTQQKRGTPPGKRAADGDKPGSRAAEALRELRNG